VHIRRALLLFAIVLGMAALAASLSRPPEERSSPKPREQPAPSQVTAKPMPPGNPPVVLSFDALTDERRRVPVDRAATIEVSVEEPGTIELPGLGLAASADRYTPARFDLFPTRPGRYEILFTPAQGDESRPAGTLVVTASG
jgi:cell division septation protein DedD